MAAQPSKTIYTAGSADTPLGPVWIAASQNGLASLKIGGTYSEFILPFEQQGLQTHPRAGLAGEAAVQVAEYLRGMRRCFDLPIDWDYLTVFKRKVLQATFAIPFGQTITYARLAQQVGQTRAARAVGRAQATNPLPLVIPCHRVLGSDGKLHGYGAGEGLKTKAWLLALEGVFPYANTPGLPAQEW